MRSTMSNSARRSRISGRVVASAAAAFVLLVGVFVVTLPDSDHTFNDVADSLDAVVTTLDPLLDGQSRNL